MILRQNTAHVFFVWKIRPCWPPTLPLTYLNFWERGGDSDKVYVIVKYLKKKYSISFYYTEIIGILYQVSIFINLTFNQNQFEPDKAQVQFV